jgi:hypothetical protein
MAGIEGGPVESVVALGQVEPVLAVSREIAEKEDAVGGPGGQGSPGKTENEGESPKYS